SGVGGRVRGRGGGGGGLGCGGGGAGRGGGRGGRRWGVGGGVVRGLCWVGDTHQYENEPPTALRQDHLRVEPLRLQGAINVVWLGLVVLAVALLHEPWREILIVTLALVSLWMTPRAIREANGFTFYPIVEVAVLFFGIFLTMIPALELLRLRGGELGVRAPWQFYWASGMLSSFLDNAPTYLT